MQLHDSHDWDKPVPNPPLAKTPVIETPKIPDPVNHPSHYNQGGIEAIVYLKDSLGAGFTFYLEGNIKKYLHRWRYKGKLEDLKKARWYLDELIKDYAE